MNIYGSFYGRETSLTQGNVFKIYVTDNGLYFARVSDRIYPEAVGKKSPNALLLGGLGGLAANAVITQPAIRKQKEAEAIYDALDLDSAEFLSREPKNFRVPKSDMREMQLFKAKGLMKSDIAPGTLEMIHDGKKRKFALTSAEPGAEIDRILRLSMPNIAGSLA